jgi:hypothetical protein
MKVHCQRSESIIKIWKMKKGQMWRKKENLIQILLTTQKFMYVKFYVR